MSFRFFTITVRDDGTAVLELNAFLRRHRVLAIERSWVEAASNLFWSICVDYLDVVGAALGVTGEPTNRDRGKCFRELLSSEHFAVFAMLRDLRKQTRLLTCPAKFICRKRTEATDRC